ncbi:MAG: acetolactate synthase small subunit [Erysipelotrichaceae bacterium]|nr:acetolactate synthase small subunit [Erysipelotrichaceae bacterium]MDD3808882.1 acetolactate synthase small subunit [Erysipelotrichaceae bacterium]
MEERFVLSILVENNPGVLSRVSGLFSRRGYSIDSLSVGKTTEENISRMTVVARGDEYVLDQIQSQLSKLVEVIEIIRLPKDDSVYRELVLIKVSADAKTRGEIISIADVFRANVIDVAPESLIIEATGDINKINGLVAMIKGFNIVEIVRTGLCGMLRGVNDFDIDSKN